MALIVLTSASGSPGVSTTALGLALGWHRPVLLVEADPTGACPIAAGYLRGQANPPQALIDLAQALQRPAGQRPDLLTLVGELAQPLPGTHATWLPGSRSHEQAHTLMGLWEPLTGALRSLEERGMDVLVDAGRLGLSGYPLPLLRGADLALLLTRTDMAALAGARSWAAALREQFTAAGAATSLALLPVGLGRPFTAREVTAVLGVEVLGAAAWDPPAAAVLSKGADPPRGAALARILGRDTWQDCALLRSYRGLRSQIAARIRDNQDHLATTGGRTM